MEFNPIPRRRARLPLRTLARVACVASGLQYGWALQLSLLTPYVQELGIPHAFASYIWLCGPVSGMLVQPIIGYYSDNCESKYGRRRPFIVLGAIFLVVAVLIISFAADLGHMLGDSLAKTSRPRAIALFILGFWVLDLANNTLQGPCRALLADFTGKDQRRTRRANAFFSLFIAMGNVLGFAAGSYNNWPRLLPFTLTKACELPCANLKSAFLLHILFLITTTLISITAAVEIPWTPTSQKQQQVSAAAPLLLDQQNGANNKPASPVNPSTSLAAAVEAAMADEESEEETEPVQEAFIWELLGTFKELPRPMWYILLVTALTWIAWFPFLLFDTDWMGREVYQGKPNSSDKQMAYLYDTGVRTGALGLMLNSVVLGISSLLLEPMCRRVGASNLWGIANMIMSACFALTAVITVVSANAAASSSLHGPWEPPRSVKAAALAIFAILGAPLAVTYSVPYALTASFTSSIGGGQGLSMGVLNLAIVVPQMLVSLGNGPWDLLFGGGNMPSFLLASAAGLVGGVLAIGLLPRPPAEFRPTGLMRTQSSPIP